jgi:hypothetical protein
MKYLSFLIALFGATAFVNGQGSLNVVGGFQFAKPTAGIGFSLDDKRFVFEMQVGGNKDHLTGIIKAGPVLARDGRSRLVLSPKLISNVRTNEFTVSINPEWIWRHDKWTVSIGADCRLKKETAYMVNETQNESWTTHSPKINFNASVQYLMYGKRFSPQRKPAKDRQKIQHGLTWWDAGAMVCAVGSGLGRGTINALRKDPGSLQRYLGVGDYDFGGIQDWQLNYENERYWNEETNMPNKHKSEVLGNFGRDGWHTADEMTKWGDRIGSVCFVVGSAIQIYKVANMPYKSASAKKKAIRRKVIGCAVKGAVLWAVSSVTENGTYEAITTAK